MAKKEKTGKLCPCSSGAPYDACCWPFHQGKALPSPLELVRARYAAYALNLPHYLIETTHPAHPEHRVEKRRWIQQISQFALNTSFQGLEFLDVQERGSCASVTFVARLARGAEDLTFTEKSYLEHFGGRWLYRSGKMAEGRAPNMATAEQMKILPLAYYGAPVLRRECAPVVEVTEELRALISDMEETMDACDGIGLAAPQVHHAIQLFMIRKPIFGKDPDQFTAGPLRVFLNPSVVWASQEVWSASEGCLSIPSLHAPVKRPKEIELRYMDLDGQIQQERVSGWEARIILHENDHVHGVLFIDHLPQQEREGFEPLLEKIARRAGNHSDL